MWLQAQQILQTGTLTKENTEYLSGMRDKMGLSKEQAEKIIKGVQNQRLIGGLEAAKNTGSLSLQKVLDMKESGVEIDSFISEEMRLNLYTKEVQSRTFLCMHAVVLLPLHTQQLHVTVPLQHHIHCMLVPHKIIWCWSLACSALPLIFMDKRILPNIANKQIRSEKCSRITCSHRVDSSDDATVKHKLLVSAATMATRPDKSYFETWGCGAHTHGALLFQSG